MFREIIVSCLFVISANAVKNWDYTFVKLDVDIKVDYLKTDVKLERITRGDYAINGTYVLGKDLGPMFKVCLNILRNISVTKEYSSIKQRPLEAPEATMTTNLCLSLCQSKISTNFLMEFIRRF